LTDEDYVDELEKKSLIDPCVIQKSLLGYYESRQTSHGAILVGLVLALFTLLQVAQNATKEPLAPLFVNIVNGLSLNPNLVGWFRLNILFFGTWLLIAFSIHTFLRISVFSQMFVNSLSVTKKDVNDLKSDGIERTYAGAIMEIAVDRIADKKTKVFVFLNPIWFVSRGKKGNDKSQTGWIASFAIALVLTLILLFLLW
jgi:hypothetical protein